jgi:hypothetical protein
VEVDLREDLLEEIEIEMGVRNWCQNIDYWWLPFRCYRCHEVDIYNIHVICLLLVRREVRILGSKRWESIGQLQLI